tara:strand:+ start:464 stop:673 length:210 start_codon:yes stop_codon:yes gene_type:complete
MNKFLKFLFLFQIILLLSNTDAYAYIDPGTGSFIIQTILAFFAAAAFYLGYPIRFIKDLYNKIFKKKVK